ncbi:MAG: hypothetical protein AAF989_04475 [Planctomycetota bacterium]
MPKKIALDWDDNELRLVAANCSGSSIKVTDAAVIELGDRSIHEVLRAEVDSRGWAKADALIAIGRGKAELREMQLPAVPDGELPDMVRFQALRSFASAGESSTVDFLVTRRDEDGVEMIVAAIGPTMLSQVQEVCDSVGLTAARVSLRPLCSAALYLTRQNAKADDEVVLIDLLRDDAEIIIARGDTVVFVRTVRLPNESAARAKALAGELKRSLLACGSDSNNRRVILWGLASAHQDDLEQLQKATGSPAETLDPFALVDVGRKTAADLPTHTGRLAPLVGLLASDESHADRLVDFLQPRQRPEPKKNHAKLAALIGVPIAATLLLGYSIYSQFASMDRQIEALKMANEELKPSIDFADESLANVAQVDKFLDGDVNWLAELQRLASNMPDAKDLIVKEIRARTNQRDGGGSLVISGGVTDSPVIEQFEIAARDEEHEVVGKGANFVRTDDYYRYGFDETIRIPASVVQEERYLALTRLRDQESAGDVSTVGTDESEEETVEANPPDMESPDSDKGDASATVDSKSSDSTPAEDSDGNASGDLQESRGPVESEEDPLAANHPESPATIVEVLS